MANKEWMLPSMLNIILASFICQILITWYNFLVRIGCFCYYFQEYPILRHGVPAKSEWIICCSHWSWRSWESCCFNAFEIRNWSTSLGRFWSGLAMIYEHVNVAIFMLFFFFPIFLGFCFDTDIIPFPSSLLHDGGVWPCSIYALDILSPYSLWFFVTDCIGWLNSSLTCPCLLGPWILNNFMTDCRKPRHCFTWAP